MTDGPDPALSGGSRTALLEEDANINTGVINPGGSVTPLTTDPVMNDPEDPKRPNTPGMAVRFRKPIVNHAGPDIVLFDFQPVVRRLHIPSQPDAEGLVPKAEHAFPVVGG